jgi:uncharacterized protein with PIN domain
MVPVAMGSAQTPNLFKTTYRCEQCGNEIERLSKHDDS